MGKFEEMALFAQKEKEQENRIRLQMQKYRSKHHSAKKKSKQLLNKITHSLRRSQSIQQENNNKVSPNDTIDNEKDRKKQLERDLAKKKEEEAIKVAQAQDDMWKKSKEKMKIKKVYEEAKKMTLEAAMRANSRVKTEKTDVMKVHPVNDTSKIDLSLNEINKKDEIIKLKLVEDRQISLEIIEKRKREEEEYRKIKDEAEIRKQKQ